MSAHRFTVLDGMRGAAALAVLGYHAGSGFYLSHSLRHGYLAVDFFFMLSGFVLSQAYGPRIAQGMGFKDFFRRRLIRLYPMIFAGALLGALSFNPGWGESSFKLLMLDAGSFLLLPLGLAFGMATFPTNILLWSLFFELAASAAYFPAARHLARNTAKTMILLTSTAILLGFFTHLAGGLGAIGVNSPLSFLAGSLRVGFSFGAGLAVSRFGIHLRFPILPGWLPVALLLLLLALPGTAWPYDIGCVVLCFPVLLCLGAQSGASPAWARIWLTLGALSYPVYAIQEPILRAAFRLIGPGLLPALLGASATLLLAALLLRFYDEPLRVWLARRSVMPKTAH